jgi:hypothetical protein
MGAQINKEQWISLFREVGLNDEMMIKWHKLFELRHPEAHESFLVWLGLPQDEVKAIRMNSN